MRIPRFKSKRQRGFTLLEVLLAIGVSLSIGAVALTELRRGNESKQAMAVGQQSAMVGKALNTYLALQYSHIVSLANSPGVGSAEDPGPRTCTANVTTVNGNPASICTITTDTLVRSGLLPTSFSGRNAFGAEYNIYIRVVGTSPNWIVEGLVVTNQPYTTGAGNRYDLLGQAMQEAGADSGMTRTLANTMEGLNGTWRDNSWPAVTHNGITYPGVNQLGLLGYRAGYGSSGYAAYLRLDGTTPMNGSLDLDGHNIENVGTLEAENAVLTGAGTSLSMNNTTAANRTDLVTGAGTLGIRNANGVRFENLSGTAAGNVATGHLTVDGNIDSNGDISADGNLQAQDVIASRNMSAQGNLSVGGTIQGASVSTTGNGNIIAGGTGEVRGYTVRASNAVVANNYTLNGSGLTATGGRPWFYDNSVTAWRTTGALQVDGAARAGSLEVDANARVGGSLTLSGASSLATAGTACSTAELGQLRRSSSTDTPVLACANGFWRSVGLGRVETRQSNYIASPGPNNASITVVASCPSGTRIVGGGYLFGQWAPSPSPNPGASTGGYDGNAPSRSYADAAANQWVLELTERTGRTTFAAQALCAY